MDMGSGSFHQVPNVNESPLKFGCGSSSCSSSKSSTTTTTTTTTTTSTRVVVNNTNNSKLQVALRCQVEGCSVDLSGCKPYYGKHKVCAMHSKSPMAIVAGHHQRFCQQCSRFHHLSEFDQGKRSCRRRLAGHNERRRKPPSATVSSRIGLPSSSFHDNSSRLRSFLMNFAYPDQLSGRNMWATIAAGDQTTGARLSVPEGPCSDTGCARSLLSAQPLGNMLSGNQAPNATTASVTTSMAASMLSSSYSDQASIVPCKDGLGSWGFPSKLELACQRKRQCLDNEGNRSL